MTPRDNEDSLDEEFPEGDGTADTEATVACPYCAESVEITIDPDGGEVQEYVQDCEVCCRPWNLSVHYNVDGHAEVTATAADE